MSKKPPGWDPMLPEIGRKAALLSSHERNEEALRHATEFLDTLPYKGERLTLLQRHAWPRAGVFRDDGTSVAGVPDEIKKATALVASFILAKIPFGPPALAHVFLVIGHLIDESQQIPDRSVTWH